MALYRGSELSINEEYEKMLKQRSILKEAVTSNNSIHEETERLISELSGDEINLNPDELEERLKELEKNELTSLDKKVITNIRKNISVMQKAQEDFEKFTKGLKYEYVVSKKAGTKSAEESLNAEDENFKADETGAPVDGIEPDETVVPAEEFEKEPTTV